MMATKFARFFRLPSFMQLVGFDDILNQLVPDDVVLIEITEFNFLDIPENALNLDDPGTLPAGKVNLRNIPRHDSP